MANLTKRIELLAAARRALPATLEDLGYVKSNCIQVSRIGSDLLREEGLEAQAIPVRAWILNRAMWEWTEGDFDRLAEKWSDEEEQAALATGAWSVALGFGEKEPRKYPGHLVLATRNPHGLLDLSLGQASRPQKEMPLEPAFLPIDQPEMKRFLRGEGVASYHEEESGMVMVYVRVDDEVAMSYRSAPDWCLPTEHHRRFYAEAIDKCRAAFHRELNNPREKEE